MDQIIGDAMNRPVRSLYIDRLPEKWTQEDMAYVHRQTCGPHEALGSFGYQVWYLGLVDEDHRYQVKRGDEIVADVPASQLEQTIEQIVAQKRSDENEERIARMSDHS